MTTRTYFLPPDFLSYPAPQPSNPGAIGLGQLILDINDPGHTVGTLPPLGMAGYDMPISTVNVTGMGQTDNSSYSSTSALSQKFSSWLASDSTPSSRMRISCS
ncbi:hypothetical protein MMC22_007081 [Lobaria immixta]|nr:hypothetical protein [Lobaria immixta]